MGCICICVAWLDFFCFVWQLTKRQTSIEQKVCGSDLGEMSMSMSMSMSIISMATLYSDEYSDRISSKCSIFRVTLFRNSMYLLTRVDFVCNSYAHVYTHAQHVPPPPPPSATPAIATTTTTTTTTMHAKPLNINPPPPPNLLRPPHPLHRHHHHHHHPISISLLLY